MKLDTIINKVCEVLKIHRETCLLSHPYGTYKDARMIIAKIAQEKEIKEKEIAEAFNLKTADQVYTLVHNLKMRIYNYPDSVLNDRYKRCKSQIQTIEWL